MPQIGIKSGERWQYGPAKDGGSPVSAAAVISTFMWVETQRKEIVAATKLLVKLSVMCCLQHLQMVAHEMNLVNERSFFLGFCTGVIKYI